MGGIFAHEAPLEVFQAKAARGEAITAGRAGAMKMASVHAMGRLNAIVHFVPTIIKEELRGPSKAPPYLTDTNRTNKYQHEARKAGK